MEVLLTGHAVKKSRVKIYHDEGNCASLQSRSVTVVPPGLDRVRGREGEYAAENQPKAFILRST
jgi:hypothetical protein